MILSKFIRKSKREAKDVQGRRAENDIVEVQEAGTKVGKKSQISTRSRSVKLFLAANNSLRGKVVTCSEKPSNLI